jgi:hypothetical protein
LMVLTAGAASSEPVDKPPVSEPEVESEPDVESEPAGAV